MFSPSTPTLPEPRPRKSPTGSPPSPASRGNLYFPMPSYWRYWYLPSGKGCQCKPVTLVYKGPGFTARYKITFHDEGA